MQTEHNIRLTSAEIAHLWANYMSDSASRCALSYYLEKTEDIQVKAILQYALQLSEKHIETVKEIFKHENYPIPLGFTNEDVVLKAPRLFSDTFHLQYILHMTKLGLPSYGVSLGMMARSDVRTYFSECLAMEITQLWQNTQTNAIGKALVMAFSQVAKSIDVRDYMVRGKQIAAKHMEIFGSLLTENDVPSPVSWDSDVMDSKVSPTRYILKLLTSNVLIGGFSLPKKGLNASLNTSKKLGNSFSPPLLFIHYFYH